MTQAVAVREQQSTEKPVTTWWWVRTVVSWLLLFVMVALLAALVVVPRLTGATPYTVLTGSMEPGYPPGSLIVVKPVDGAELNAGDVITFQPESGNPAVITHRIDMILYNSQGERRFITKGDANNVRDDGQLKAEQIRGRVWYSVPYLGYVNNVFTGKDRSVLIGVVSGGLLIYAAWAVSSGMRERGRNRRGQAFNQQDPGAEPAPSAKDEGQEHVS